MGLNAPWGHGKTTTINRLEAYIQKDCASIGFIKYDAFKSDYTSDVFVSITSCLTHYLEDCAKNDPDNRASIEGGMKSVLHVGGRVLKSLLKNGMVVGVKVATSGLVDIAGLSEGISDVVDAATKETIENASLYIDTLMQERLTNSNQDQSLIEEFSEKLQCAIAATGKSRLIFVIDELDRCRPSFSVEVLEKIKHFFNVNNVLFVLVYNKQQLEKSISHIYGVEDTNIYLHRFIDLENDLSIKVDEFDMGSIKNYINWVIEEHEFDDDWKRIIKTVLSDGFKITELKLSLRSIGHICSQVASYCLIRKEGAFVYDRHLITTFCMLYVCRPDYYEILQSKALEAFVRSQKGDFTESIGEQRESLQALLSVFSSSEGTIFRQIYEYIAYYLFITNKDGTVIGQAFTNRGFGPDRDAYINKSMSLVSALSIAD